MFSPDFLPGAPNWIDLGSPDINRSADFYASVLGWNFVSLGEEAGNYGFFQADGRTVAALGPLDAGQPSAWTVYFATPDADATAKAVEQAGGTIRLEPFDVFTNGRMAQFTDPGGAEFAVWQAGDTKGVDALQEPGALAWVEVHTPDREAAQAFYQAVFGWTAAEMPGSDGRYTLFTPEGSDTPHCGAADLQQGTPAHWLPHFEVDDVDAAVAKAGEGTVIMPATDYEGVGRLVWLADPFGARFALMKTASR
ncbi:hydroxylase [Lentzea sp. NBRC 105346]|uniref:VOC family protein n=1 Tax=Lentzea sp. NBRC 105346 TaxID=3032205 RepID=UPI0024A39007|nr:VOC family protein [Lentzea sp. NBRC 105346]GLZ36026.1 hydroxylase [Lentzea sp. NBRC 105346]